MPLYRQYNPNAVTGSHNFTTNKAENDSLVAAGWNEEGIGWYGEGAGRADAIPADVAEQRQQAQGEQQGTSVSQGEESGHPAYVYVTKSGKAFHREGCPSISGRDTRQLTYAAAVADGRYDPCKVCKP